MKTENTQSLVNLITEYRKSMSEDVLRSWASDIVNKLKSEQSNNSYSDNLKSLIAEYRPTMTFEVLHSWSRDLVSELN